MTTEPPSVLAQPESRPGIVEIRHWFPGHSPELIGLGKAREVLQGTEATTVSIDVFPDAHPHELFHALAPICGEDLTTDMIHDLLERDPLPQVLSHHGGRVRNVSAVGVHAKEPRHREAGGSRVGRLVFESVEMLAGPGWLITCRQETQSHPSGRGGDLGQEDLDHISESPGCEHLLRSVEHRWVEGNFSTAGDLGVLILHELTCSYRAVRTRLHDWLDSWEVAFFCETEVERQTLTDLRTLISEFRRRLTAMNVPEDEATIGWFAGVTNEAIAKRADRHIDHSLDDLNELGQMLRTTFDLVQMQLSQRQQKISERLGRKIEVITSVFLVPTLIAGIFGANTRIPGEPLEGPLWWTGFVYMAVAMVVGASLVYTVLRLIRRSEGSA